MKECYLKDKCKKYKNGTCMYPDFCIKKFKIDKFYEFAELSELMKKPINLPVDIEDQASYNELTNVIMRVESFVDDGENLYIHSPITGNGKTAWSVNIIKAYIDSIWYEHDLSPVALFVNVPRYLLSIKDAIGNKNEYADRVRSCIMDVPLVVWDDIATKDITEFESENLLSIIDYRFNSCLSNIFTSNVDPADLSGILGRRLSSRIVGNTKKILFTGKDQRLYDSITGNKQNT